jgi:hypothetical protein
MRKPYLGDCPNARPNERRIRSRFPKPFFLAISSAEKRPAFIINRADSTRSRSIAFAGDCPVSSLNSRPNCRGPRQAVFANASCQGTMIINTGSLTAAALLNPYAS